jgi:hypothetical protein
MMEKRIIGTWWGGTHGNFNRKSFQRCYKECVFLQQIVVHMYPAKALACILVLGKVWNFRMVFQPLRVSISSSVKCR